MLPYLILFISVFSLFFFSPLKILFKTQLFSQYLYINVINIFYCNHNDKFLLEKWKIRMAMFKKWNHKDWVKQDFITKLYHKVFIIIIIIIIIKTSFGGHFRFTAKLKEGAEISHLPTGLTHALPPSLSASPSELY